MNTVRRMRVENYDSKSGVVQLQAIDEDGGGYAVAQFLSRTPLSPDNSGGGEYIYPREGSYVLVQTVGNQNFILGFYQSRMIGTKGKQFGPNIEDVDENQGIGGYRIENSSGSYLSLLVNGVVKLFAAPWAKIHLNQLAQHLWADVRNLFVNTGGGRLRWTTTSDNKSDFLIEVTKQFDPTSDADLNFPEYPVRSEAYPEYSDKFIIRSRPDDAHVVEFETRQAIDSNIPNTQVKQTWGKDSDGDHSKFTIVDVNGRTFGQYTLGNDYLQKKVVVNGNNTVVETVNNDGSITIDVNNGAAQIIVQQNGEIRLISSSEKIYIGAENNHQPVVLAKFLQDYLQHVHMGNLGVTTSPPMFPFPTPQIDPSVDEPSENNWQSARTREN